MYALKVTEILTGLNYVRRWNRQDGSQDQENSFVINGFIVALMSDTVSRPSAVNEY